MSFTGILTPRKQPTVEAYEALINSLPELKFFDSKIDIDSTFRHEMPSTVIDKIKEVLGVDIGGTQWIKLDSNKKEIEARFVKGDMVINGHSFLAGHRERLKLGIIDIDNSKLSTMVGEVECFSSVFTPSIDELTACLLLSNLWLLISVRTQLDCMHSAFGLTTIDAPTPNKQIENPDDDFISKLPKPVFVDGKICAASTYHDGLDPYKVEKSIVEYFGVKVTERMFLTEKLKNNKTVVVAVKDSDGLEKKIGEYTLSRSESFMVGDNEHFVIYALHDPLCKTDDSVVKTLIILMSVKVFAEIKRERELKTV